MRILFAILHYYAPTVEGFYASERSAPEDRGLLVRLCLAALWQNFAGAQSLMDGRNQAHHPVNSRLAANITVALCTTGDSHLASELEGCGFDHSLRSHSEGAGCGGRFVLRHDHRDDQLLNATRKSGVRALPAVSAWGNPGRDFFCVIVRHAGGLRMPIYETGAYQVRPQGVEKVKKAIGEFVDYVKANEPGSEMYLAWQQKDDPTRFLHLFIFADENARKRHGLSEAVKRFKAAYTPELVGGDVIFTEYEMIAGRR